MSGSHCQYINIWKNMRYDKGIEYNRHRGYLDEGKSSLNRTHLSRVLHGEEVNLGKTRA